MRIIAAFALVLLASSAEAADVDWKMYGGASVSGQSLCFYDTYSIVHPSSGVIRFWTKCLPQNDLDRVLLTKDEADDIATKIARGYIPPLIAIKALKFEKRTDVVMYEEIADRGTIEPQSQIFIEINCTERRVRRLETSVYVDGNRGFEVTPSEWEYISPESNPAYLLKILCPRQ